MKLILGFFTIIIFSLGLTGCYKSEKALITGDNAVFPFSTITYAETKSKTTNTLLRVGDKYVHSKNRDKAYARLMLVQENLYVVQISEKRGNGTTHLYALIKLSTDGKGFDVFKGVAGGKDIAAVKKRQSGLSVCDTGLICISSLKAYIKYAVKAVKPTANAKYRILSIKK